GFFGSGLLEGRNPLAFVWISMQSLRILYTLLIYCFVQHVDACRSLPFGLLRRRGHFVWGKFIALKWFTMGPPRQKSHLWCRVSPCEEKSTALLQSKKN